MITIDKNSTKEEVLEAVKQDCWTLRHASLELRNNKEIVMEAIRKNANTLQCASDELKNDKTFILEIIKIDGNALQYVSSYLKNDKEVVMEAIKQKAYVLSYASKKIKNDKTFIFEAVQKNGFVLEFASKALQKYFKSNDLFFEKELEDFLELKEWTLLNKDIIIKEYKIINKLSNEDYEKEKLFLLNTTKNRIEIKKIKEDVQNVAKILYNKYVEEFNAKNIKEENIENNEDNIKIEIGNKKNIIKNI
jgi:hypothetical protein